MSEKDYIIIAAIGGVLSAVFSYLEYKAMSKVVNDLGAGSTAITELLDSLFGKKPEPPKHVNMSEPAGEPIG